MGEREVAEHLLPLLTRGFRVFHDVPAKGANSAFNLDHVAVGPSGVALIETKTRRKGRARSGMKDHVVAYDGNQLIWPWGEDRHGLEQAISEADWLGKFIHERTGIDTTVKPILAVPGWWVESKARGVVAVVNAKNVASAVEGIRVRPTQNPADVNVNETVLAWVSAQQAARTLERAMEQRDRGDLDGARQTLEKGPRRHEEVRQRFPHR